MKLVVTLVALGLMIGCTTPYQRISIHESRFFTTNRAVCHANTAGLPSEKAIDTMRINRGDSVYAVALATRNNRWTLVSDRFYLCAVGADSLWIDGGALASREDLDCIRTGGIVKLPKSQSEDAWGRATVYVNKYSSLRIQVASDNIIDTYNPVTDRNGVRSGHGYTITRRSIGDSVVIEIETKGGSPYGECHAFQYIKYGK